MFYSKMSGDYDSPRPIDSDFQDKAANLGLCLNRNASTGIYVDKNTEKSFNYFKKNKK